MFNDQIAFALIGCGRIAERHIDAIAHTKNAVLVSVCDLNFERASEKAKIASVPAYADYHDMLQQHPEIDVVIILTPSGMHFEHTKTILEQYKKHILIEKPMVMTVAHGLQLEMIAKNGQRHIFPIYQNRFNKAVQRVKQAISSQSELGAVRVGTVRVRWCRPQRYYDLSPWRGTWAMDGGAFSNQGIHYIDLLRYLCGDVKRVHAKLSTMGVNIEVEDTGVAILEFENGALGVIEIMTSARPDDFEASISCVCEKGLAEIAGIATNQLKTFTPNPADESEHSEVFKTVYGYGHNIIIEGVVNCLMQDLPPAISFSDGLKSIQLLHALYRSDEIDGWVDVDGAVSERLGKIDDALANLYRNNSKTTAELETK